jgi:hypothetical protein
LLNISYCVNLSFKYHEPIQCTCVF